MVAGLIEAGKTTAAARLAVLSDQAERAIAELKAVRYELGWLLERAQEIPMREEWSTDEAEDDRIVLGARRCSDGDEWDSLLVRDCSRLRALIAGEIPSLRERTGRDA